MAITGESRDRDTRVIFYTLWFIISVCQAWLTNLIPDEAYYWKYSTALAWGYYDHPPAIAAMIRTGYSLFNNELGVRSLSIFAMMGTIRITEYLTRPKDLRPFYLSIASMALLHMMGFLAVPDSPLLFFTACFLLLYKRYSEKDSIQNAMLLSVCIALLLLSKYHGILLILFTLLSNLRLLQRRSLWMVFLGSSILFLPHVMWQFDNDLPSIQYHLFGRNQYHYEPEFTLNYLLSIVLIFAPLTGVVIQYFALRKKIASPFEKTLKYNLLGGLAFFFLMSFKGRVEGNWILYLLIPSICLGYPVLESKLWHRRFIRISFVASIALILIARAALINDLWNTSSSSELWSKLSGKMQGVEYIGWEAWAKNIKEQAGHTPVAFINSYQKAAEYEFYSGEKAFSLNNIMGRSDQYNIWNYEDRYQGKKVFVTPNYYEHGLPHLETNKGTLQYDVIEPFYSSSNITIYTATKEVMTDPGDSIKLGLTFHINEPCHVNAEGNDAFPMFVSYQYFNDNGYYSHAITDLRLTNAMLQGRNSYRVKIPSPADKGDFTLFITISTGWLPSSINKCKISVHNR